MSSAQPDRPQKVSKHRTHQQRSKTDKRTSRCDAQQRGRDYPRETKAEDQRTSFGALRIGATREEIWTSPRRVRSPGVVTGSREGLNSGIGGAEIFERRWRRGGYDYEKKKTKKTSKERERERSGNCSRSCMGWEHAAANIRRIWNVPLPAVATSGRRKVGSKLTRCTNKEHRRVDVVNVHGEDHVGPCTKPMCYEGADGRNPSRDCKAGRRKSYGWRVLRPEGDDRHGRTKLEYVAGTKVPKRSSWMLCFSSRLTTVKGCRV